MPEQSTIHPFEESDTAPPAENALQMRAEVDQAEYAPGNAPLPTRNHQTSIEEPAGAAAGVAESTSTSTSLNDAAPPKVFEPYKGVEGKPSDVEPSAKVVLRSKADLLNIGIILAGCVLLLLLLPTKGDYPVIDDPFYAGAVQTMLRVGHFVRPDSEQPNLVGLVLWGAAWCKLFGFSFITLTNSVLVLALAGVLAFYGVARLVRVPPGGALLGATLLASNPIYLHLSFSFMTDVPLLALMLIACFFYVLGMQSRGLGVGWMWLGSAFAAWGFYVRQFGVLVPLGFAVYLLSEAVLTRKVRWAQLMGVVLPTGVALLLWYLAERNTPPNAAALQAANQMSKFVMKEPWLRVFLLRTVIYLPLVSLSAWAAVKLRLLRWWLIPIAGVAVIWCLYNLTIPGESWVLGMDQGPFVFTLGPISITFPQVPFAFGDLGNIVRVTGIDFFRYRQEQVLTPEAWRGIWALGVVLGILLVAKIADALLDWLARLVKRDWKITLTPLAACYIAGAGVFVATAAFVGDVFDRYMVGFLPFVILFVVRGSANWKRPAWTYSIATAAVVLVFSYMLQADFVDHDNARYAAGRWLQAHVQPALVSGGWDWMLWENNGQENNAYTFSDIPFTGLRVERTFPYFSRLGGFTTRYVLAQSSPDKPPLPVLPGDSARSSP